MILTAPYIKARLHLQPYDLIGHPEWEARFPFHNTLPFVFEKQRVLLLATPKAGITSATNWAFANLGLMAAAKQYHPWVHRYRTEIYVQQQQVRAKFRAALEAKDFSVYKVVRNPWERLVSSFHHAIKHRVLPQPPTPPAAIQNFEAFLNYLEGALQQPIDPHLGLQKSVYEAVFPNFKPTVLPLEDLENQLSILCASHGFEVPFSAEMAESKHHAKKSKVEVAAAVHLMDGVALFQNFPNDYQVFFQAPHIKTKAAQLLAPDLKAYGF